jgi:uncharacterized protein
MQVVTLNKTAFSEKCTELISKLNFNPELIIGILNGGGFVVEEMKNQDAFKSSHFELVKLQRNQKVKHNKAIMFLLKTVPYLVSNWLRVLESKKVKKSMENLNLKDLSNEDLGLKFSSILKKPIETILIVDDAIDTGKTMFLVKNNLVKWFPEAQIKIAVISWTIETSIVKPDYFIFKDVLVRFPWSKDYKAIDRL